MRKRKTKQQGCKNFIIFSLIITPIAKSTVCKYVSSRPIFNNCMFFLTTDFAKERKNKRKNSK